MMIHIVEDALLALYNRNFGTPKPGAEAGLRAIIQRISGDKELNDTSWVAYILATIKHECADTWRPIEEYGKGRGRPYGEPVSLTDQNGKVLSNVYYGRGYVQLTWKDNYRKLGQALGLGEQLMWHPELALQPDIAYSIASFGMRNGSFTGKKLGQFLHDGAYDYFNAREIINKHDQAARIQEYAQTFEVMLKTCANEKLNAP
jgi:putative chitinase